MSDFANRTITYAENEINPRKSEKKKKKNPTVLVAQWDLNKDVRIFFLL